MISFRKILDEELNKSSEKYPVLGYDKKEKKETPSDMPNIEEVYGKVKKVREEGDKKKRDSYYENIEDWNAGLMDLEFQNKPSEEWIKRAKENFTGEAYGKNLDGGCSKDGAKRLYDKMKKRHQRKEDAKTMSKWAGLKSRMYDKDSFAKQDAFEGIQRLNFKNRVFLSNEDVIRHIPQKYMIDENRFYMRDAGGTNYLVECHYNPIYNRMEARVINELNIQNINEELEKINKLSTYKSSDFTKKHKKDCENKEFMRGVDINRRLIRK